MLGTAAKLALIASLTAMIGGSAERNLRPPPQVALLYVGAEDCAPCRIWRNQHWPDFAASTQFKQLNYREVVSPKLFTLLHDEHWPEELRHYRDKLGNRTAVPYWVVTVNGQVAVTAMGLGEWEPTIRRRLNILFD